MLAVSRRSRCSRRETSPAGQSTHPPPAIYHCVLRRTPHLQVRRGLGRLSGIDLSTPLCGVWALWAHAPVASGLSEASLLPTRIYYD